MPEDKVFLKITEVSERFNEACVSIVQDIAELPEVQAVMVSVQLWQAKAMFGMAQQLAMISKHLGDITAECERAARLENKTSGKKV